MCVGLFNKDKKQEKGKEEIFVNTWLGLFSESAHFPADAGPS